MYANYVIAYHSLALPNVKYVYSFVDDNNYDLCLLLMTT